MDTFVNTLQVVIARTSVFIKSKLYPAKLKVHNQPTSTHYVEDTHCEPVLESVKPGEPVLETVVESVMPVEPPAEKPVENSSECVSPNDSNV